MKAILTFIVQYVSENQDTYSINVPAFIAAIVMLLVALWVCIVVSKKNRLYIKPKEKNNVIELQKENEVA